MSLRLNGDSFAGVCYNKIMFDMTFDFLCLKAIFKHHFCSISWRPVFIGRGSWNSIRKPLTSDRKTNNSSQLRLHPHERCLKSQL